MRVNILGEIIYTEKNRHGQKSSSKKSMWSLRPYFKNILYSADKHIFSTQYLISKRFKNISNILFQWLNSI